MANIAENCLELINFAGGESVVGIQPNQKTAMDKLFAAQVRRVITALEIPNEFHSKVCWMSLNNLEAANIEVASRRSCRTVEPLHRILCSGYVQSAKKRKIPCR